MQLYIAALHLHELNLNTWTTFEFQCEIASISFLSEDCILEQIQENVVGFFTNYFVFLICLFRFHD